MLVGVGITNTCRWCCCFQRPLSTHLPKIKLTSFKSSSPLKAPHSLDVDSDDIFLPWLSNKAGSQISTLLYIAKTPHGGRGLFASKSIEHGDCLLRVPFSVQLAPDNLPQEIRSLLGNEIGNVAKLAMLILSEKKLGQDSQWAPYINRLPKAGEINSTIFWSDDELEMIKKSCLHEATFKRQNNIEKEYLAAKPVLHQFPGTFGDVDLEDFKHAVAVVGSRAWESTRGVSMVPFADFLNHDSISETCVLYDEDEQTSEVIADYSYSPGDQVLIRYGTFSNSTLMLDYGFTLPHNIHDQVQVKFEIPHNDPLRTMKLGLLRSHITPSVKDVNGFSSSENSFTIKLRSAVN